MDALVIFVLAHGVKDTLNTPMLFPPHCSLPSQHEPQTPVVFK